MFKITSRFKSTKKTNSLLDAKFEMLGLKTGFGMLKKDYLNLDHRNKAGPAPPLFSTRIL